MLYNTHIWDEKGENGTKREGEKMLVGEYNCTIDSSRRVSVPVAYKKDLEGSLVVSRGFEKCLYVFRKSDWEEIANKLAHQSLTNTTSRQFVRAFTSGSFEVEVDVKGRICLTQKLVDYANLDKDCIIIGSLNHAEIWSEKNYEEYLNSGIPTMEELSKVVDI